MHSRFAAHFGFVTHLASSSWQLLSRHLPIAAPSAESAGAGLIMSEAATAIAAAPLPSAGSEGTAKRGADATSLSSSARLPR